MWEAIGFGFDFTVVVMLAVCCGIVAMLCVEYIYAKYKEYKYYRCRH